MQYGSLLQPKRKAGFKFCTGQRIICKCKCLCSSLPDLMTVQNQLWEAIFISKCSQTLNRLFEVLSTCSTTSELRVMIGSDVICKTYRKHEIPTIGYVRREIIPFDFLLRIKHSVPLKNFILQNKCELPFELSVDRNKCCYAIKR